MKRVSRIGSGKDLMGRYIEMRFYIGLHVIANAREFENSFISVNVLKKRKSCFSPMNWILDSGAFTQVLNHGDFTMSVGEYAEHITKWSTCGNLVAAVSQDYMCEPFILKKWNRSVRQHQIMTIERFFTLLNYEPPVYILPVLQGYSLDDYLRCADMYGFPEGCYVGIGSVCKRNKNTDEIKTILKGVVDYTGFSLHGFGLKLTALRDPDVRKLLSSSDSMSWSFNARAESNFTRGNRANDWTYAMEYYDKIREIEGVV